MENNTIIFFEDVDFWPKIYLILYHSFENFTVYEKIRQTFFITQILCDKYEKSNIYKNLQSMQK